jgi:hypothetical protein
LENTIDETFYQQHKRTTKLVITDHEIDAVKKVELPGFDAEENVKIQELHKKLLTRAKNKNNSNEVGMLVNLRDWSDVMVDGTEEGVTLKGKQKAYELLCTAPKNSLLFFHNHPKNSLFSEKDLESFMISDAIWMMSVVCNNGRLYFLIKTDKYNREKALVYYEHIFENGKKNSVQEFIRTCGKVGLNFIYGGE